MDAENFPVTRGKLDLFHERGRAGSKDELAVSDDDHRELPIDTGLVLDLEDELAVRDIRFGVGEGIRNAEALPQELHDGAETLEGDPVAYPVLTEIAGFDELSPGHGIFASPLGPDDRLVVRATTGVAVDPAAQSRGPHAEDTSRLAHRVDLAVHDGDPHACIMPHQ